MLDLMWSVDTHVAVFLYSLYRATSLDDAELKFTIYHDKLPVFIEIAKEVSWLCIFLLVLV